jgi:GNAT superfamily N-acetyltransferase
VRSFELRTARAGDAEAGGLLHRECWRETYGPLVDPGLLRARLGDPLDWVERWRQMLDHLPPVLAVSTDAESDGELVGFALSGPARREDAPTEHELYAVYAREAWHGSGAGQALFDAVVAPGRPVYCWVLEANGRARAFYARQGMVPDGMRKRYDPLDAWELRVTRP